MQAMRGSFLPVKSCPVCKKITTGKPALIFFASIGLIIPTFVSENEWLKIFFILISSLPYGKLSNTATGKYSLLGVLKRPDPGKMTPDPVEERKKENESVFRKFNISDAGSTGREPGKRYSGR